MATAAKNIALSRVFDHWGTTGDITTLHKFLTRHGVTPVFEAKMGRGMARYYNLSDIDAYKDQYLNGGRYKNGTRSVKHKKAHAGTNNIMSWQTMIASMRELHEKVDNIVPSTLNNTLLALTEKVTALEAQVKLLNETWGVSNIAPLPPASATPDDEGN